jgi:DNA-binding NarL/FixJ family response regulator
MLSTSLPENLRRSNPPKVSANDEPGGAPDVPISVAPLHRLAKGITVLLAEERMIVRQGLDALLAPKKDITVIGQAADCQRVFELADELRPDVVIIALGMALRNGLESLRRILESRCGAGVIVLLPHHGHDALAAHVAAAGAAGCLTEQTSAQLLATAVRKVHATNQSVRQGVPGLAEPAASRRGAAAVKDRTHLTAREREVLQLIAEGNANKQTASKLCISIKTVEKHRQHLMDKLNLHETASLTRYAVYAGIA